MGLRVRWGAAVKGAALIVAALLALQALPGLLKPPDPPPLPADVGLPRGGGSTPARCVRCLPGQERQKGERAPRKRDSGGWRRGGVHSPVWRLRRERSHNSHRKVPLPGAARKAGEGAPPRRQDPPAATPPAESDPSPTPALPPEAAAPPLEPAPPPPAPDDGSMEFAPH